MSEGKPTDTMREQAEQLIEVQPPDRAAQDPRTLLHELQVHQIELEMQNDALQVTKVELQAALARASNLFDFAPMPYLTADLQGRILQANHAAGRLFNEPRTILCQLNLHRFISVEHQPLFDALLQKTIESGCCESGEIKLNIGGDKLWVVLNIHRDLSHKTCLIALEDVTEKKQLEQQVRERVRELEQADRRKTEFLATLAHELRNPMSPLLMIADLLQGDKVDQERLSWAMSMIHRQVKHLARLVDDLLDVSRINRGQINLKRRVVDLRHLLREAVEMCQPLIDAEHHQITVDLPEQPVEVMGDPVRLVQVVSNLLTNAIKFTSPEGQLALTLDVRCAHAIINVKDNGLGIDSALLGHVFEQFGQLDTSTEKSKGGLGVGLYLARALVLMHGGTIEVCSPGLGKGSEFTAKLPLHEAPGSLAQTSPNPGTTSTLSLRRILVVDDNRDAAYGLKLLLADKGHEVCVAHDGYAALELAKVFRPELILLDIFMQGMDGYEVCCRIREEVWGKGLLIIALSGFGASETRHRAVRAGFDPGCVKTQDLVKYTQGQ